MNTYDLRDKLSVLSLAKSGTVYTWTSVRSIWSKAERTGRISIFSSVGKGAPGVKLTIRKQDITRHNALKWNNSQCVITDIAESEDRRYLELSAAMIEPVVCKVTRTAKSKDEYNRPVYTPSVALTFPAYLTEKYMRYAQDQPMTVSETALVLVVPKSVEQLNMNELVEVSDIKYEILACRTLDEYKNEYEISRKDDA
jgi:hypothetical protein